MTRLTPAQCARELAVSDEFIRGEIRDGRLVAQQFKRPSGRTAYRIDRADFDAYLTKHWPRTRAS